MKLQMWVDKFLEDGGKIILCKPKDKPQHRCGGKHCLFGKCKKKKFEPIVVLKKRRIKR